MHNLGNLQREGEQPRNVASEPNELKDDVPRLFPKICPPASSRFIYDHVPGSFPSGQERTGNA